MSTRRLVVVLLGLLPMGLAGQERNSAFMVHQLCVASPEGVATANAGAAEIKPILDALVQEGMISAWYDLRHGWGDEYNLGTVTVAESHRAWLDFWSEFLSRVRAHDPDLLNRMLTSCEIHKDNMYNVRDMGGGT